METNNITTKESKNDKPKWTLMDWDGNPELGYKCWRKCFGRGHVSVGVGDFKLVVFSYGNNSEDSYSGTRWNYDREEITPEQAMKWVDKGRGKTMIRPKSHQKPNDWRND